MHGLGDIDLFLFRAHAHGDCLSSRHRAVIYRRVGDFHSGQLTDHCLIFENGLQHTLGDFRLIRCVGSDKFLFVHNTSDNRRDVMAVCARAAEDGFINGVLIAESLHEPLYFQLALSVGQIELPFQFQLFGHIPVQVVKTGKARLFKHFLFLLFR